MSGLEETRRFLRLLLLTYFMPLIFFYTVYTLWKYLETFRFPIFLSGIVKD